VICNLEVLGSSPRGGCEAFGPEHVRGGCIPFKGAATILQSSIDSSRLKAIQQFGWNSWEQGLLPAWWSVHFRADPGGKACLSNLSGCADLSRLTSWRPCSWTKRPQAFIGLLHNAAGAVSAMTAIDQRPASQGCEAIFKSPRPPIVLRQHRRSHFLPWHTR